MDIQTVFIDRTPVTNRQIKELRPRGAALRAGPGKLSEGRGPAPIQTMGRIARPSGSRWTMHGLTAPGRESGSATTGSGSMQLKAMTAGLTPGTTTAAPMWSRRATKGRMLTAQHPVGAHPAGVTPFGGARSCQDGLAINRQQTDSHTRRAILRGGSAYRCAPSIQ